MSNFASGRPARVPAAFGSNVEGFKSRQRPRSAPSRGRNLHDEFFAKHQLNYLADIVRVLVYTGLKFNFYDVLVMAIDEQVLREQVEKARQRMEHDTIHHYAAPAELRDVGARTSTSRSKTASGCRRFRVCSTSA